MTKRTYLILLAGILLLLAVAPVYAAPSLSLGSTASYKVAGKLVVTQSCTADPIAYAYQACTGIAPVTTIYVSIIDNGQCTSTSTCHFSPETVNVTQGNTVVWNYYPNYYYNGSLSHTVTANTALNGGLPSFDLGPVYRYGSVSFTFNVVGKYYYYDKHYPTILEGVVNVTPAPPPPPPPKPTTVQLDLTGTLGWNVEGLSSSQANLLVSHDLALSISPLPGVTFTPVTESGSFEQSINLATRAESPGTASSLVKAAVSSYLRTFSGYPYYYNGYYGVLSTMLAGQSNGPEYTQWWVNGPLSMGSPVQILHGWSSVTDSEVLNLGTNIGTRQAWIVTSQVSQNVNLNIPNPSSPDQSATSAASANLNLLWSFDRHSDLLLRNNDTLTLTTHTVAPQTLYNGCYQYCPPPITVSVNRDMAFTANLTLLLSSTTVSLTGPGTSTGPTPNNPTPSQGSQTSSLLGAIPWMPLGLAGLVAGAIVGLVLLFRRRTIAISPIHGPSVGSPPAPTASS